MRLQQDVAHGTWDYPFQVHNTELTNGLSLYPHVHSELEITCITKGQGIFCINGQDYPVNKGTLLVIPSEAIHLAYPTMNEPASFFSIVFSPACFCLDGNNRIYTKYIAPILERRRLFPEYLCGSNKGLTDNQYSDIWRAAREVESAALVPDGELLTQGALLRLWYLLFQLSTEQSVTAAADLRSLRLKDSIDYMHANFSSHISISDLASIAHMSEGHFSRTFKDYMKMSPLNYLIKIRIRESAKLLKDSSLPIGEIALSCGFNDFSYFGRHFKREMKCSPRKYRNDKESILT